jgi:hypothetical protein
MAAAVWMVVALWVAVLTLLVAHAIVRAYRRRWRQRILTVPVPAFTEADVGAPIHTEFGRYVVHEFVSATTVVIVPETR